MKPNLQFHHMAVLHRVSKTVKIVFGITLSNFHQLW